MKSIVRLGIVVGLLVILFSTNPTIGDFSTWAKEQVKKQNDYSVVVNVSMSLFGDALVENLTKRDDYVFFSLYTVELGDQEPLRTVGVFNRFIPISGF